MTYLYCVKGGQGHGTDVSDIYDDDHMNLDERIQEICRYCSGGEGVRYLGSEAKGNCDRNINRE